MTVDERYLSDAAHFPGGHAAGVERPASSIEVASIVARGEPVLAIGAQSSLTGGATPMGELLLSTERLTRVLGVGPTEIRVEAGVTIDAVQHALAAVHAWFPPAPTFTGATAGGVVATNAAGAATFKYGSTRAWVEGLTIVLADGSVLSLRRGEVSARGGWIDVPSNPPRRVPVPTYTMPDVAKRSAGYYAAPAMDLVDLFVGSEGTLGVLVDVTFRAQPRTHQGALALVPCDSEAQAIAIVDALRRASQRTWAGAPGLDASAIEHMDRRCIDILREDGADRRADVTIPGRAEVLLLVQLELPASISEAEAFDEIASASAVEAGRPLADFCRVLDAHALLEATEIALPGHERRQAQFVALREAVPAGVNARVGRAQHDVDGRIAKTAADMVVPFERFGEMMQVYRREFARRRLDVAVWGHISDGNVHPNVLPRRYDDVEAGKAAILACGREVSRMGGCPLAEHGVGRNPVKQALLRQLYGEGGIEEMRAVRRALDPHGLLAPGVIFSG